MAHKTVTGADRTRAWVRRQTYLEMRDASSARLMTELRGRGMPRSARRMVTTMLAQRTAREAVR